MSGGGRSGSLRWVLRFGRAGRRGIVAAVVLGALASGTAVGLTATSAWLIARASQQPPVLHLMVAIVAVRAFGLGRGLFRYLERLVGHDASFRILGDLRAATVERLERILPEGPAGPDGTAPLSDGELLSRFVGDVDDLQDLWARLVVPAASAVVVGAGTVVLVTALTPAAGAVLAASLVAAALLAPVLSRTAARGAGRRLAPLRGRYRTDLLDVLDGSTELAVYGALPGRLERLDRIDGALARAEGRSAGAQGLGAAVAGLAGGVAMVAGLWLGADAVAGGALRPVDLAVVALVPLAVHEVVAALAAAAHRVPELEAAAARTREVFERPPTVVEPARPVPLPAGPYGLRATGLTAGWGAGPVLRELDLDLPPGSTTMVVGPSGSGKSTLAALLLRLLDPLGGTLELVGSDGTVDATRLDGDELRRVVGWCAQDAYVFDSSIEANLRLARPDATPAELRDALARARLVDWVDELPRGLDTMVGEHGRHLSGGQRQRLALARVLLADRPVVVLDEPTEHLDEDTGGALARDLLSATRDRTVLVLTHRPELFAGVARLLRLEDGALVAQPARDEEPAPGPLPAAVGAVGAAVAATPPGTRV